VWMRTQLPFPPPQQRGCERHPEIYIASIHGISGTECFFLQWPLSPTGCLCHSLMAFSQLSSTSFILFWLRNIYFSLSQ
jgi:hypothetical protein